MNDHYLDKLHGEILTIMDDIHRVCQEQNLRYYLTGGTLLGAARHGGFIPWDDDLDIVMPRDDFEKFIKGAEKWLSSDYSLEWITTNTQYVYYFAKITKKNTLFLEFPYLKRMGIFVDVFPIDSSSNNAILLYTKKNLITKLINIMWHKVKKDFFPSYWFMWLPSKVLSFNCIHRMVKSIASSSMIFQTGYYANYGSQYSIRKQTMPKEWWGHGKQILFQGHHYIIPTESKKILRSIFGENYMELPPENKRRCHYPLKVRFSDGEEMEFEYDHRITVEEQ